MAAALALTKKTKKPKRQTKIRKAIKTLEDFSPDLAPAGSPNQKYQKPAA